MVNFGCSFRSFENSDRLAILKGNGYSIVINLFAENVRDMFGKSISILKI